MWRTRLSLVFTLAALFGSSIISRADAGARSQNLTFRDYHLHPDFVHPQLPLSQKAPSFAHAHDLTSPNAQGNVVELLIVCDMEWGDLFNHDRQRILDYWTVFMWDVDLRYKTMPSLDVSFVVVDVIVTRTKEEQPFIENSRAEDGRANLNRILENFSDWIYEQNEGGLVAKHDMAIVITNAAQEWCCGLAWVGATCLSNPDIRRSYYTAAFVDRGEWSLVNTAAHEIGHNLGGPHDDMGEGYPGGCTENGYIMNGSKDDLRWFFSTCSDRTIGDYVRSSSADCLRRTDNLAQPVIDPNFISPKAPDMTEQCQQLTQDPTAFAKPDEPDSCLAATCIYNNGDSSRKLIPLDNSICDTNKRCFRGRCRPAGTLFQNVGTSLCLQANNRFSAYGLLSQAECPREGTLLDRFVVESGPLGLTLATPYSENHGDGVQLNADKCVYTLDNQFEGATVAASPCTDSSLSQRWQLIDVGQSEFLIQHQVSGRCIRSGGGTSVFAYNNCVSLDPNARWRKL